MYSLFSSFLVYLLYFFVVLVYLLNSFFGSELYLGINELKKATRELN